MGRNQATANYLIGSFRGNAFNIYLFGSAILTTLQFLSGLTTTQSFQGALLVAIDYYISKLTPFPVNEFLTANGFIEVVANVLFALVVGLLVATYRYRKNRYGIR